jgi:CHAT domain-containing protein
METKFRLSFIFLILSIQLIAQDNSMGKQYSAVADTLFDAGKYELASGFYQKAVGVYQKSESWNNLTHSQNRWAESLSKQGKFDLAEQKANESLKITEEKLGKESKQEADAYNTLGLIQLNKGRSDLALEFFQKAIPIYGKMVGDNGLSDLAETWSNIGLVYWNTDNSDLALEYQLKALATRKKLFGKNNASLAASYNDLGLIYANSNQKTAQKYYQKALEIYESVYGENHPKTAFAYINLATTYRAEKEFTKSLDNYDKALAIWRELYGEDNPNQGFVYNGMGQVFADQENWVFAIRYHEQALALYKKTYGEKHPKVANTYNQLGSTESVMGNHSEALDFFQKALIANSPSFTDNDIYQNSTKSTEFFSPTLALASLQLKARSFENYHYNKTLRFRDLEMALSTLELADELIGKIRQTRSSKKDKIALGATASEIYEEAIRICFASSEVNLNRKFYWEKAFNFAEKNKSAVLLGAISDTQAKSFANIPDSLVEAERELKSEISVFEQKRAEATNTIETEKYREQLFALNKKYAQFVTDLESKFPEYFNLKYNVETAGIPEIQAILQKDEAMISYFLADNDRRVYGFIITPKSFETFNVSMHKNFEKFQIGLQNAILYQAKKVFHLSARKLFEQLFPQKLSNSTKKLLIIPSGSLGMIPFEVLLSKKVKSENTSDSDLPYLVKDYIISYHFSATLFAQTFAESKPVNLKKIALFAPETFSDNNGERNYLNDLPGTKQEVEKIAEFSKKAGLEVTTFLNENAQETSIKSEIAKAYDIMHLATHGTVNQTKPELSRVYFANSNDSEDGNLNAGEIYTMQTNWDLIVMSACQTGLGELTKGEGIIGLTRAWIYAGVRNIQSSYWTVSDESTSLLMQEFYKNLLVDPQNPDYAKALRLAKLKMIENEQFANPYYWGAFVLIGK